MHLDSVRASRHCEKLPIQKLTCTLQARQRGRGKEGPPCGHAHRTSMDHYHKISYRPVSACSQPWRKESLEWKASLKCVILSQGDFEYNEGGEGGSL